MNNSDIKFITVKCRENVSSKITGNHLGPNSVLQLLSSSLYTHNYSREIHKSVFDKSRTVIYKAYFVFEDAESTLSV